MLNYDIKSDLSDQKRDYLAALLVTVLVGGIPMFAAGIAAQSIVLPPWLTAGLAILISNEFRRRDRTKLGAWVFLLGLMATFTMTLVVSGPSTNIYLLMLLPLVISIFLIGREGIINLAVFTAVAMFGATLFQTVVPVTFFQAVGYAVFPIGFCGILTAAIYINANDVMELVYWATDLQQKDTRRAEMFYEQREQLSDALRQLTHAHSRLELLNSELEIAKQKTEQASQAKSIFLSNMSHELRTPLNVIIGYTSTMLDMPLMYNNASLPPAYRSDIQLVKDNGYYLLGLINDILDLSKIEAGKLELHRGPVELADVFRGALATAIGLVKDKPVQVRPDYADKLPCVYADATRVRQIILNLMSNAIKFTHTGSVTLQARVEGDSIRVSVIDTGIGIPEKALAHIFDRFEQAERDTDKHYGGTGLGLDISKQLAKMHGSDLNVTSTVGQGSTFSFLLPISTETLEESEKGPQEPTAVKTLVPSSELLMPNTILLVEDETSLRDMMHRTLESVGHVVVDIQDGAQVVEAAVGLLPDLIILDVRLPNINGWNLLEILKQNPETAHIPIIICTVDEDEQKAIGLGAQIYIQKPFSSDELLSCVQELLPNLVGTDNG